MGGGHPAPCSHQRPSAHCVRLHLGSKIRFKEQTEAQHRATQPNYPSSPQLGGAVALPEATHWHLLVQASAAPPPCCCEGAEGSRQGVGACRTRLQLLMF